MRSLSSSLRSFGRSEEGTVKIEFIIVFPLILAWIMGSFVFFDAYKTYSRASKATFAVSDIVSRQTSMDLTTLLALHDIMDALVPWSDNNKWIRITSLEYVKVSGNDGCYEEDTDAVCEYRVLWSHASGTPDTLSNADLTQDVLDILPDIAENDTVILTETHVPYEPLLDTFGLGGMAWSNQQATRPRYVSSIAYGT